MPYLDPAAMPGETGLAVYGSWISARGTTYGPYAWDHHQLVWVIDGSATLRSGEDAYEAPPDAVLYTPAGVEHVITWDEHRPTRVGWANFRIEPPDDPADYPRLRLLADDDVVITLLNHLLWLSTERTPGWAAAAQQAFDYVLVAYRTGHSASRSGVEGVYSELVARATSTVQRHWRGGQLFRLTLDDLAAELGVSRRHLTRTFAEEFGVGPITTFRMLRILEGARLLVDTTLPLREIATLVGFANEFHFSRTFKTITGFPPARYRSQAPLITRVPARVIRFHKMQTVHFHPRNPGDPDTDLPR